MLKEWKRPPEVLPSTHESDMVIVSQEKLVPEDLECSKSMLGRSNSKSDTTFQIDFVGSISSLGIDFTLVPCPWQHKSWLMEKLKPAEDANGDGKKR